MRMAVATTLLLLAPLAAAVEARDARGLAVAIERIAEPIVVDGVTLHVQRAQGREIDQLARRIELRWRAEGSQVQRDAHSGWQIRSRLAGLRSEVIQWRAAGAQDELVFSWFDVSRRREPQAATPVTLPPMCTWLRGVEGSAQAVRYLQLSARCRIDATQLANRLHSILARHDWTIVHRDASIWDVARRRESARVTLVPAGAGETALVWLTTAPQAVP